MFDTSEPTSEIPVVAYQLADHLDAALAAAEDLTAAGREWVPATANGGTELAAQMAAERQVIERVRAFEAMLIGRILKARKRASVLARSAGSLAGMTQLFVGGTAVLVDAIEELGDSTWADFDSADGHISYLRNRGAIPADAWALPEDRSILLGDANFMVAGRLQLAPLMEMVVAFLDALEAHYDLYPDEAEASAGPGTKSSELADILTTIRAQAAQNAASESTSDQNSSVAPAPLCGDVDGENGKRDTQHVTCADAPGRTNALPPAASSAPRTLRERLLSAQLPAE